MPPDTGDDMDLPQTKRRALRFLGRRGTILFVSGVFWVAYGIGLATRPLPQQPFNDAIWHENIPAGLRAAMWITAGLVAIAMAFRRAPGQDTAGFVALSVMPTLRLASYAYAFLVYLIPGDGLGDSRAWITATFYAWIVAVVVILSGWPEPGGHAPASAVEEPTSNEDDW